MSCQFANCSEDGNKALLDKRFCPKHHAHELAVHRLQFSPPTAILNAKGELVLQLTPEIEADQRVVKVLRALQPERDKRAKAFQEAEDNLKKAAAETVKAAEKLEEVKDVNKSSTQQTATATKAADVTTTVVVTKTETQAVAQTTGTEQALATGGPQMSMMTKVMMEGLGDVKDASYRVGAIQLVELVREPLVAKMVASQVGLPARKRRELKSTLLNFFASDYGKAILAGAIGVGLSAMPTENVHLKAIGKELRVNSMTTGINSLVDVVMGPVRQVLSTFAGGATVSEIEAATGVRVATDSTEIAQLEAKKQSLAQEIEELEATKAANQPRVHVARNGG